MSITKICLVTIGLGDDVIGDFYGIVVVVGIFARWIVPYHLCSTIVFVMYATIVSTYGLLYLISVLF